MTHDHTRALQPEHARIRTRVAAPDGFIPPPDDTDDAEGAVYTAAYARAVGDLPGTPDPYVYAADELADDLDADPLGGAPDCGNGCDGPAGHAEGCPVHCHCYDFATDGGDDTIGDGIVFPPGDLDHPPLDLNSTYADVRKLAIELFGGDGGDVEIDTDEHGDVFIVIDRHPDDGGGSYTPDEIRELHKRWYGDQSVS